jgi:hypothetical protein
MADLSQLLQKEICELFGVTRMSISRWTREGLPRNPNGTYPAPRCVAWLLNRLEERLERQAEEEGPETAESARWLAAFRRERYKLSKLERRQREGGLVPWSEIIPAWQSRVGVVTSGLEAFADRLSPLLAGKGRDDIHAILKAEVRELRLAYARDGKYTPEGGTNG